jgi:hypothetical protein
MSVRLFLSSARMRTIRMYCNSLVHVELLPMTMAGCHTLVKITDLGAYMGVSFMLNLKYLLYFT